MPDFDHIINRLEEVRARYYAKTKGLFKRAFFRTWLALAIVLISMAVLLSQPDGLTAVQFIGPGLIAAFLSLIGAGLYSLIKKGGNLHKFTRKFKEDLVTEMVQAVNPDLGFYDEGISTEEFDRADLFPDNRKTTSFSSEDKISGTIKGTRVVIAECHKRGRVTKGHSGVVLKVKGVPIPVSHSYSDQGPSYIDYFKGLFVQMELRQMVLPTPLKVLPAKAVKKEVTTGFDTTRKINFIKPVVAEDRIVVAGDKPYELYCQDKDVAARVVNEKFIKILDYIYGKYYQTRPSVDSGSFLGNYVKKREVFISIVDDKLYLALSWNKDMFDPDKLMKQDLRQSGVAREIYTDLLFIDQIIKEVSLFNQV